MADYRPPAAVAELLAALRPDERGLVAAGGAGLRQRPGADAGLDEPPGAGADPGHRARSPFSPRSRQRLWRKGETSGNFQQLRALSVDCDGDAVLLKVAPSGPACHTGETSCFFRTIETAGPGQGPMRLFDSAAGRVREFAPADPELATMYVCGPTVYGQPHVGNARAVVVFDVLYRLLRRRFRRGALRAQHHRHRRQDNRGRPRMRRWRPANGRAGARPGFHEVMARLGTLAPDLQPLATEHIEAMIAMIERLIAGGHAYAAAGHVLFDVASYPAYGSLANRSRAEMIAGARVEVASYKRSPGDFVLWKPAPPAQPGWRAPGGGGGRAWHIECSAMIRGVPGREHRHSRRRQRPAFSASRERKRPELLRDRRPAACPLLGAQRPDNRRRPQDGQVGRKLLYRRGRPGAIPGGGDPLRAAVGALPPAAGMGRRAAGPGQGGARSPLPDACRRRGADPAAAAGEAPAELVEALADDLNTPQAFAFLHELAARANRAGAGKAAAAAELRAAGRANRAGAGRDAAAAELRAAGRFIGLLEADPAAWLQGSAAGGMDAAEIGQLVSRREQARSRGDYEAADRIRQQLADAGVAVEDGAAGSSWRRR